jgi:acetylornithine deacetylase/succinyl-diaminopimelate desuccinylase-like protein
MTTPYDYLQANRDRIVEELKAFVRIPSVSTDPAYSAGVREAADWVAGQLRGAGPFAVRIMPTARHPVVYAEWLGAPGKPTVLVYGHYDVQPTDPLDKWITPPFEPDVRDGRIYARGVSDDKGPMFLPVKAAEAFFATEGVLPINVKFLLEGEEECSSPSLPDFIRQNADMLTADFAISADGAMWRIDEPSVSVSSRGIVGLQFTLTGAAKDLHSGRHGGAVANPLHAMAQLVASLHSPDGRVTVEGFYDDVEELSPEERAKIARLPFDEKRYLAEVGAPALFGEPGYSTLERVWIRPTLEINGMWGGYEGPGGKTVTPSEAHAKVTCRLVPNQDPDDIAAKVTAHLRTHLPEGVTLDVSGREHGVKAYQIPADHPGLLVSAEVLREVYCQEPLTVRIGGTLPVADLFLNILNEYTIFFSFSTADEDFHAPNEFFRIHRVYEGLEAWARYWKRLAEAYA